MKAAALVGGCEVGAPLSLRTTEKVQARLGARPGPLGEAGLLPRDAVTLEVILERTTASVLPVPLVATVIHPQVELQRHSLTQSSPMADVTRLLGALGVSVAVGRQLFPLFLCSGMRIE